MAALAYWREMAKLIDPNDREERKWHLIAVKRADELEVRIRDRRNFVVEQLTRAESALQAGRPSEAMSIRAMLKDKYGHYLDLRDLLGGDSTPEPGLVPPTPPSPEQEAPSTTPPTAGPESRPPQSADRS